MFIFRKIFSTFNPQRFTRPTGLEEVILPTEKACQSGLIEITPEIMARIPVHNLMEIWKPPAVSVNDTLDQGHDSALAIDHQAQLLLKGKTTHDWNEFIGKVVTVVDHFPTVGQNFDSLDKMHKAVSQASWHDPSLQKIWESSKADNKKISKFAACSLDFVATAISIIAGRRPPTINTTIFTIGLDEHSESLKLLETLEKSLSENIERTRNLNRTSIEWEIILSYLFGDCLKLVVLVSSDSSCKVTLTFLQIWRNGMFSETILYRQDRTGATRRPPPPWQTSNG